MKKIKSNTQTYRPESVELKIVSLIDFHPRPGQRIQAISAACVDHSKIKTPWPELEKGLQEAHTRPGEVCWLALPEKMDDETILAVCRSAHEVWIMEDELQQSEVAAKLKRFRTESAPPELGERKSVLHAPEVGPIRIWQHVESRMIEHPTPAPVEPPASDLYERMQTIASMLCDHDGATPEDWTRMANTMRTQADRLRYRVRACLAMLFTLTSAGIAGLQWLAMSSFQIPMADLYAVFFLLVGSIYLWGRKLQWNSIQLAWQALADALEIQALLSKAGLRDGVVTALYQLRHRRQIEWVREALRPMSWAAHQFRPTACQDARQLLCTWAPAAQLRHQAMAKRQAAKALWLERGMKTCYTIGAILTVLVIGDVVYSPIGSLALSAGIGLISSLGTLLLIFNGVLGFAQDASLHRHLQAVFVQAQRCLGHEMSPHEYEELLLDLGQECVQLSAERTLL